MYTFTSLQILNVFTHTCISQPPLEYGHIASGHPTAPGLGRKPFTGPWNLLFPAVPSREWENRFWWNANEEIDINETFFHPQARATSLTHPSAAVQIRFIRAFLRGSAGNKGLGPIKKSWFLHVAECCQRGWRMPNVMETEDVIAFWQGGHCNLK